MKFMQPRRLTLRLLVGITLVTVASMGLYASHLVRKTQQRLLEERARFHELLLETNLPAIASAIWHFDSEAKDISLRSLFRSGETQEMILIPVNGDAIVMSRTTAPGEDGIQSRTLNATEAQALLTQEAPRPHERLVASKLVYIDGKNTHELGSIGLTYSTASVTEYAQNLSREVWIYTSALALAVILATWAYTNRVVLNPIRRISRASLSLAEGRFEKVPGDFGKDEIGNLGRTFNLMVERLEKQTVDLKGLLDVVKRQNAELRRANEVKDQILANTSHELRTPLNGIIGVAEALLSRADDSSAQTDRGSLLLIRQSAKRLEEMVTSILNLASLKRGGVPLELAYTNVAVLMARTISLLNRHRDKRDLVEIHLDIAPDLPLVPADPLRLEQVLTNLIGNALKFTLKGSVTVSASVEPEKKCVWIRVADTGIGIPEEARERIFLPFVQANGSVQRRFGGTGLGLAIAKEIVDLHGGTLEVRSREGEGSTFSFSLPLEAPIASILPESGMGFVHDGEPVLLHPEPEAHAMTSLPDPAASLEGQIPHVLVVDDEPVNRMAFTLMLPPDLFRVSAAESGQEALAILEKSPDVQLILCDIMMPEMSGYELCAQVREKWNALELPVVFVSAKTLPQDLAQGFDVGGNDYITKPVHKDELVARIRAHLSIARRHFWVGKSLKNTCAIVASQNRYTAIGRATSFLLSAMDVDTEALAQVILTPPVETDRATVRTFKIKLIPRKPEAPAPAGVAVTPEHTMVVLGEEEFASELRSLREQDPSPEQDWLIIPLQRGSRETGTLILTNRNLAQRRKERTFMTALGDALALVLENIANGEAATHAQLRTAEQRVRALGHAAMRLSHGVNNPLAVIQWANEEMVDVLEKFPETGPVQDLQRISRLLSNSILAIHKAVSELDRYKAHASASDSLRNLDDIIYEPILPQ